MKFKKYVVKKGDSLGAIAQAHGIPARDWKKLYNHPKNAPLRKLRPDPNKIEPKDVVFVPEIAGGELDKEAARLNGMLAQLQAMPPSIRQTLNQAKRMAAETQRITKSGEVIRKDIDKLRALQTDHTSQLALIDAKARAYGAVEKKDKSKISQNARAFADFQRKQETLSKLINTMKTINDAERHLKQDPNKAHVAIGVLQKDMAKIQKLTAEWEKAHAQAVKEIEGQLKSLSAQRKKTI